MGLRDFFFFFNRNGPFLKYEKNWGSEGLMGEVRGLKKVLPWLKKGKSMRVLQ